MRYGVGAVLFLIIAATGFAQNRAPYWSLGGYGNVLFPGTGHAPGSAAATPNFRVGGGAGRAVLSNPFPTSHGQHGRTVIVPYPVFYGGGLGYGYDQSAGYAPGYADQPAPVINTGPVPSVVINQNFIPQQVNPQVREYNSNDTAPEQQSSGMRLYHTPSHPYADAQDASARPPVDAQPTIYLIAFKDHSIVQALGYWMEGATLHYVSAEHSLNQASLDLIDRDLSQRLNDERGLEFKLPAAR